MRVFIFENMFTIDLHLKNETVVNALYNMKQAILLARKSKEHVICFIVGYGSKGGSHKIKTACLEELEQMKNKNQIIDYIISSEIDIFNIKYQKLKGKQYLNSSILNRKNPGEIIVII